MKDWRYWFAEQKGTLLALAILIVMFTIYASNHPAGFSADVVTTAANKGVLLALVAMAQTLVVITAGIDLSVGMVFTLCNCLASYIVVGDPPGRLCDRILGDCRLYVGRADQAGEVPRLYAVGAAGVPGRALSHLLHLFGRSLARQWQYLHPLFDCRGGARRRIAIRRNR